MSDRPSSALERLWSRDDSERKPRLGLSLERVVQSGIELADADGLGAVSMKRVAERLGFTTMSLYRHVSSKDELLLLMQDTVWQPPAGLDVPRDGWRSGLAWWTRRAVRDHGAASLARRGPPHRAGRHAEPDRLDGPGAARRWPTSGSASIRRWRVLLLLSGYVSTQSRLAATSREGAAQGLFAPDEATEAFGELLRTVVDAERFPALRRAVEGGAFAPQKGDLYASFDFGLDLMLDGIERLIERQASD